MRNITMGFHYRGRVGERFSEFPVKIGDHLDIGQNVCNYIVAKLGVV